jgi:DNA-binding HxlR family transcriptional regulator
MNCSVARSLDVIGEWWTMVIVRDVFMGLHRFEEIRHDLGISRKVLTNRLNTLVEHGVLRKVPIESGFEEYRLTQKGVELHDVLVVLRQWGDKWEAPNGAPIELVHDCGNVTHARLACDHCNETVFASNVTAKAGPGHSKKMKPQR